MYEIFSRFLLSKMKGNILNNQSLYKQVILKNKRQENFFLPLNLNKTNYLLFLPKMLRILTNRLIASKYRAMELAIAFVAVFA